jgi:hypothetical protein
VVRVQIQPWDFASRRQHGAQLQLCVPQVVITGESYRMRAHRARASKLRGQGGTP